MFVSPTLFRDVKAVIFDCDGILVDTEQQKFEAWQEALASLNIPFTLEDYMPMVGHSSKSILRMIEQKKQLTIPEEIIKVKNERYWSLQKQGVPPIQAMIDWAFHLAEQKEKMGLKLGLASSASQKEIFVNLQQIGLDQSFDLIISGSDDLHEYQDATGKNKPKPYIYIEAAKRLNLLAQTCLVFEDTKAGIDAAKDAGMQAIAVPNRFTIDHDFSRAHMVLHSHQELSMISEQLMVTPLHPHSQ